MLSPNNELLPRPRLRPPHPIDSSTLSGFHLDVATTNKGNKESEITPPGSADLIFALAYTQRFLNFIIINLNLLFKYFS